MQTCEVPDFWGLHKNKNCAFALKETEKVQHCMSLLIWCMLDLSMFFHFTVSVSGLSFYRINAHHQISQNYCPILKQG